jgi:hypothetical protein
MTQEHPITPPPELVEQWAHLPADWNTVATLIAQWGADAELEACCAWLRKELYALAADSICAARRPKPPSLKELALDALNEIEDRHAGPTIEEELIRRALEQLPNYS